MYVEYTDINLYLPTTSKVASCTITKRFIAFCAPYLENIAHLFSTPHLTLQYC